MVADLYARLGFRRLEEAGRTAGHTYLLAVEDYCSADLPMIIVKD
jgi:hypothetical protein